MVLQRTSPLLGVAIGVVLIIGLSVGLTRSDASSPAPAVDPMPLADTFLDRYVTPDGRVLRRDQGGDVVSEGEAYAMVLAEMANRPRTVRVVWRWTTTHLQREDGLLSWHATAGGQVLDPQSAGDADVLAAGALLSYRGPDADSLHKSGRRLAAAVLAHETVVVGGRPVLVAGPWAAQSTPPVVDPSYWMPSLFRRIAASTHDGRWSEMAD